MSILCYHAVDPAWSSRLSVPPALFAEHCIWLARKRKVIGLSSAAAVASPRGSLPRGVSSVTFDDGLASLYTHAWPILRKNRIPATIFLVAQTLAPEGKTVDWIDNPPGHDLETLALEQILEMQEGGIEFGSHSYAHANLAELAEEECEQDLHASRELLEDLLRRPVPLLAYPRGLHNARVHRAARRAGFEFGFGTSKPPEARGRLAIPRVGVYPDNGLLSLRIKSMPLYPAIRTSRALGRLRSPLGRSRPAGDSGIE